MYDKNLTATQTPTYEQKRKELITNALNDNSDYYGVAGRSQLLRSDLMLLYISLSSQQEGGEPGLEIKDKNLGAKIQVLSGKMRRLM